MLLFYKAARIQTFFVEYKARAGLAAKRSKASRYLAQSSSQPNNLLAQIELETFSAGIKIPIRPGQYKHCPNPVSYWSPKIRRAAMSLQKKEWK